MDLIPSSLCRGLPAIPRQSDAAAALQIHEGVEEHLPSRAQNVQQDRTTAWDSLTRGCSYVSQPQVITGAFPQGLYRVTSEPLQQGGLSPAQMPSLMSLVHCLTRRPCYACPKPGRQAGQDEPSTRVAAQHRSSALGNSKSRATKHAETNTREKCNRG